MALHGSVVANLSPILFKGNNRALGVNVIIHQDESGSMDNLIQFYSNGTFIGALQDALLAEKIGGDIDRYPNLYAYFGSYSRNPSSAFVVANPNGTLNVTQAFMRGEVTGASTISKWTTNYFSNITTQIVNICTDVVGTTTGGRLTGSDQDTEDVHGNIWSVFTSPNAISTGTPGRFGSILGSNVRKGSTTIIITNSNEQANAPGDMINELVTVSGGNSRTINGPNGEVIFRSYRVIALSSYASTDGNDGVLFYGSTSTQPYGYIKFTGPSTYTITRSSTVPNWTKTNRDGGPELQYQDTLTLASESRGGLFKIGRVFTNTGNDYRLAFSKCIAEFVADTI
jgi:hypothetical protein